MAGHEADGGKHMNIADAKQQVKDTVESYLAVDELGMYAIDPVE